MRCRKCAHGAQVERVSLRKDGHEVGAGWLCSPCLDTALDELEVLRRDFQALIDAGVGRLAANQIMIARVHGEASS